MAATVRLAARVLNALWRHRNLHPRQVRARHPRWRDVLNALWRLWNLHGIEGRNKAQGARGAQRLTA